MPVQATIQFERRPDVLAADMKAAVAAGNQAALQYWYDNFRPLHFLNIARSRYGYQPRSGDDEPPRIPNPMYDINRRLGFRTTPTISNPHYSWAKRRIMRHNLPLVWSGRSADASRTVRLTATPQQGKLAFIAMPKYFFQYLKAGTYMRRYPNLAKMREKHPNVNFPDRIPFIIKHDQPKKFEELIIVTQEEAEAMAQAGQTAAAAYLNAKH